MISGWYHDLWNTQMGSSNEEDGSDRCAEARAKFLEARQEKLEAGIRRCHRMYSGENTASERGSLPNGIAPPPPLTYIKAWSSGDKLSSTVPPLPTLHRAMTECAHQSKRESPLCRGDLFSV